MEINGVEKSSRIQCVTKLWPATFKRRVFTKIIKTKFV